MYQDDKRAQAFCRRPPRKRSDSGLLHPQQSHIVSDRAASQVDIVSRHLVDSVRRSSPAATDASRAARKSQGMEPMSTRASADSSAVQHGRSRMHLIRSSCWSLLFRQSTAKQRKLGTDHASRASCAPLLVQVNDGADLHHDQVCPLSTRASCPS